MGQNEKVEKAPKTSWFSGLKAEFQKIIWPEKQSVIRQTIAVLAVSVVTGLIIALLDWGIRRFPYWFTFLKRRQSDYDRSELVCSSYLFRL